MSSRYLSSASRERMAETKYEDDTDFIKVLGEYNAIAEELNKKQKEKVKAKSK